MWKFSCDDGKERGLIVLFVLHSLDKKPKSGYDLIKEIKEKTEGMWKPSKGTLYPVLNHLEEEKLIAVLKREKRSKNIFELTKKGKKMLTGIKEHKKESREKMLHFRSMLTEIFGENKMATKNLLFDMGDTIESLPSAKKDNAIKILKKCLADLKEI